MPGIAQVWLTNEEIHALLMAGSSTRIRVSDRLWSSIEPKLQAAAEPLACPIPAREENVNAASPGGAASQQVTDRPSCV